MPQQTLASTESIQPQRLAEPPGPVDQTEFHVRIVSPAEAHTLCVSLGAAPYRAARFSAVGAIGYLAREPVAALLIDRLRLSGGTGNYSVVRDMVTDTLDEQQRRSVSVALHTLIGPALAAETGSTVRISQRIVRDDNDQADMMARSGWAEGPTIYTATFDAQPAVA